MKKLLVVLLLPIILAGCGEPIDDQPTPTPAQPTATMTATPTAEQAALQSTPPTTTPAPTSAATTATRPDPTATATQPAPESSPTSSPLPADVPAVTADASGGTPASPAESPGEDQPTATATPVLEPTSTPTASPTPTATPPPAPTATPSLTATPTPPPPPTASPTPTQPPVVPPSPTPVPEGISEDEYVDWAYDIFIRSTDTLIAYSELLLEPGFERAHPDNAAWYASFVAVLGEWESQAAEAAAQPAPSSLAAQHQEIVDGYGKIGEAARLYKLAYDTSDGNVLAQADELFNSGNDQISAAMAQLPPPSS